jgi:hypothetical protein
MVGSRGAAPRGAVCVEGGALKVRAPRLPKDEPLPARAKASAEKPKASAAARVKIRGVRRKAIDVHPAMNGNDCCHQIWEFLVITQRFRMPARAKERLAFVSGPPGIWREREACAG